MHFVTLVNSMRLRLPPRWTACRSKSRLVVSRVPTSCFCFPSLTDSVVFLNSQRFQCYWFSHRLFSKIVFPRSEACKEECEKLDAKPGKKTCLKNDPKPQRKNAASKTTVCKTTIMPVKKSCSPGGGGGGGKDGNRFSMPTLKKVLAVGAFVVTGGIIVWKIYQKPNRNEKQIEISSKTSASLLQGIKTPTDASDIPTKVPYVLIGGGSACYSAFRAIKCADKLAKVLMINDEGHLPYMRPPLSKEVWYFLDSSDIESLTFSTWDMRKKSLLLEPAEFYSKARNLMDLEYGGLGVLLGWKVIKIDTNKKEIHLENGPKIGYDKCLIATGSQAKNLSILDKADQSVKSKVVLYKNIADFEKVYRSIDRAKSIVIVGGGLLGSELACSLSKYSERASGFQVHQVIKESSNLSKYLPEYLSKFVTDRVRKLNVNVITGVEIEDCREREGQVRLTLSNGQVLYADQVIVAIGSDANTDLADPSKLEVDPVNGGFLVNHELQVSSDVYAAGDCASFYDKQLGRRRIEHYDNAVNSGKQAGKNMASDKKSAYSYQPMFWSHLGPDIGFEAVGLIDSSLPTVSIFGKATESDGAPLVTESRLEDATKKSSNGAAIKDQLKNSPESEQNKQQPKSNAATIPTNPTQSSNRGVIFYLKNDRVVGVVLWNLFQRMFVARHVIEQGYKYDDLNDVVKLFDMFDDQ